MDARVGEGAVELARLSVIRGCHTVPVPVPGPRVRGRVGSWLGFAKWVDLPSGRSSRRSASRSFRRVATRRSRWATPPIGATTSRLTWHSTRQSCSPSSGRRSRKSGRRCAVALVARRGAAGVCHRLSKELDSRGTVDVLRHGIVYAGHEKAEIRLAYFRPASGLNADHQAKYQANRLTVTRQLPYEPSSSKTVDLGLFLNGIPVATAEMKNSPHRPDRRTRQAAVPPDRDPRNALLRRAIVHFAVDTEQVFMTTRLSGDTTRFLPFNRGNGDRAGNPRSTATAPATCGRRCGHATPGSICSPGSCSPPPTRRARRSPSSPATTSGAPCSRSSPTPARRAPGSSYLVQHSAGSGKSNTIAWLAHRLSSLHHADDRKVFDKVVVITDRLVLDRQLQETIYQFERTHGVVAKIDQDSRQLAEALIGERARIVITTIQKFPHVMNTSRSCVAPLRRHHRRGPLVADRRLRQGDEEGARRRHRRLPPPRRRCSQRPKRRRCRS